MHCLLLVEATIAGVRHHVQTLATGLRSRNIAVTVACPARREQSFGEDELVAELRRDGVRVVALPLRREVGLRHDTAALAATLRLLRQERFDIIHTHSSKAGFVGRVAGRLAGIPVVHTPHSLHFLGQASPLKRQFYLRLEQLLGQLSSRLIAVSPSERALILAHRLAPAERVALIPNGVELAAALPQAQARAALGVPEGGPLIGTLARLEAQKNPALFVRAAALVARALPAVRFVWCGGGSAQAEAERLAAQLGLEGRIYFTGYRPEGRAALAALDIFWLTSRVEGLPYALLEALALARPAIATDVAGSRDIIADNLHGRLVASDDAGALARATLDLLARPTFAATLAAAGQRHVLANYSVAAMLDALAELYHAVTQPPYSSQELTYREVPLDRQPRYVGDA